MKALLVPFIALLAGCALTSKATPMDVRYFSPEDTAAPGRAASVREGSTTKLGLGRIGSSAHLRSRIVHRDGAFELGSYDELRWTEYPEAYLRRSLERELFHEGRFAQTMGGAGPSLDVELVAFEEVRRGRTRSGRVEVAYRLRGDRDVLASGVLTVEREAASGDGMSPVVAALAAALDEVTSRLVEQIGACLAEDHAGRNAAAGAAPR